jgi:hypothetical protein
MYVLMILLLTVGYSPSTILVKVPGFTTLQACNEAEQQVAKDLGVKTSCIFVDTARSE